MSEDTANKEPKQEPPTEERGKKSKPGKKRPLWLKLLRAVAFTVIAIVAVVLIVLTVVVSYLKPERLTPLVEKYANEYLDATLEADRIEISFWHSFPRFELDVKGLTVTSKSLDKLPAELRAQLPAYADSLLKIDHFNGAINIPEFFIGKIALYDIVFDRPQINVVYATAEQSNLDIFPASAEEEEEKEKPFIMPDISLGTFEIKNGMPLRYVSIPDSLDVNVYLSATKFEGSKAPGYTLDVKGNTSADFPDFKITDLGFGMGGELEWSQKEPYRLGIDDFKMYLGKVEAMMTADIDFSEELRVEKFDFQLPLTPVSEIIALIPEEMRGELAKLDAKLDVGMDVKLTDTFKPATDSIPSLNINLKIPEGSANYERLVLRRFALDLTADINGRDLDKSTVNLTKLLAIGKGVGFELSGKFTNLIKDPTAEGVFVGGVEIDRLPKALLDRLPCKISGSLRADSRFALRKSYLNKDNFHRLRLTGDATLRNFHASMPDLPADIYTDFTELKLGTNSSFTRAGHSVDSLLTASLRIDSIAADVTGMELRATGLKVGIGCQNTASSTDTTMVNPIGGRIVAEKIQFRSTEDTLKVMLRKPTVGATLRRYKGDGKKPQLHLDIATERAFYGDRVNRALLRKALLFVTAHPSDLAAGQRGHRMLDSLAQVYPELSQDSLRTLIKEQMMQRRKALAAADSAAVAGGEVIDLSVDNSMRRLIRRWDVKGVLKAERMRVFTPYFPLRNTLSDFNMRFNSDSVKIADTKLRAGNSSITLNGDISNISKALTSRLHREPLRIGFRLEGDTIDVNEIATAVFAGASFAERDSAATFVAADTENEKALQASVQAQTTDSMTTLVIPSNIEANMTVTAKNILYSNITFQDFKGNLNIYEGAINLERMGARTSIGSINLNALYSAPDKKDASFAFGMRVKDFHLRQFLNLMPALDTIMPLLSDINGIINADVAATTDLDDGMNINIPSLKAAVKLSGDSLVLIDPDTFKKIGKWLLFKHKERNVIDHMNVEMIVNNSQLELFPFIFDMDRYKLGVMGSNDMAMNLHYHVAVLKSPLPFKFGINISGNVDNMKIRLGKAKFNEKNMPRSVAIADTTRINLVREIGNLFRRGVRKAKINSLDFINTSAAQIPEENAAADTISHADSVYFMKEGLIAMPDSVPAVPADNAKKRKKKK